MATNDPNVISTEFVTGDTVDIEKALGGFVKDLDRLASAITDVQGTGGLAKTFEKDAAAAEKVDKSTSKANETLKETVDTAKSAKSSFADMAKGMEKMKSPLSGVTRDFGAASDMFREFSVDGISTIKQFTDLTQELVEKIQATNLAMKEKRTALVTETDLKKQAELRKNIGLDKKNIAAYQAQIETVRISQTRAMRGISEEFASPATSIQELMDLTNEYNKKQLQGGQAVLKSKREAVKVAREYLEEYEAIDGAINQTTDPAVLEILQKRLAVVNEKLERQQKLLTPDEVVLYWKEQSRGAVQLAQDIKDDAKDVLALRYQFDELAKARVEAADPKAIAMIDSQMAGLQKRMADILEGTNDKDASKLFAVMNEESKGTVDQVDLLQKRVGELTIERKKQQQLFQSTKDPFIRGEMQKRYQQLTDELEKQNKLLLEQQKLKRSSVSGGAGKWSGGIAEKGGAAAKDISTFISSAKSMADSLGIVNMNAVLYNTSLDEQGDILSTNVVRMGDLINGISGAFETASARFEQTKDMSQQFAGFGDSLSNWSSKVGVANKSVLDSGKQLSYFQKFAGGAAQGVGTLSKGITAFSKVLGVAGAAFTAIQAAFDIYDTLMGRSSESIGQRIDVLKRESEVTIQLNDLIRDGSIDAINRQKQAVKDNIDEQKLNIEKLKDTAVANTSTFDQIRTVIGSIAGDSTIYGQAGDEIKAANKEMERLNKELKRLSDVSLVEATKRVAELNAIADKAKDALDELKRQEENLLEARINAIKMQDKLASDLADVDSDYDAETLANKEARDKKALDDTIDHLENLESLETDYNKAVFEAKRDHLLDMKKTEDDYIKASQDALNDLNESIAESAIEFREQEAEAEAEYQEDTQKDVIAYNKRLAKMEEDFNKAKIQRQKDLAQALFEAELDNDALSFFKLQREAEKTEKEEQANYEESRDEERKAFEEDKAEKAAQRAEAKADAQADFEEQQAQARENFAEQQAERDTQYKEDIKQAKEAFAAKMADEKYAYEESRAAAVANFEDQKKAQQEEYAEEDSLRQEQREKRRAELLSNYNQELEYFQKREELLTQYIDDLRNIKESGDNLKNLASGQITSEDDLQSLIDAVMPEYNRLKNKDDKRGDELNRFNALSEIINDQSGALEAISQGVPVVFSQEQLDVISGIITEKTNSQIASTQSEYSNKLKYEGEDYNVYKEAVGGNQDTSTYDKLAERMSKNGIGSGYYLTDKGWATQAEIDEQAKREAIVRNKYGDKTLSDYESQANEEGAIITKGFNAMKNTRDTAQRKEVDDLGEHFYEQQETSATGFMGLNDTQSQYYDESGVLQDSANQTNLDKYSSHYGDIGTATDEFGDNLEAGVTGAYTETVDGIVKVSKTGTAQAADAYRKLATEIVAQAQAALNKIKSMSSSGMLGSSSSSLTKNKVNAFGSSKGFGSSGLNTKKPTFAAKGAFIERPTALIAGEGSKPEVVFPYNQSKGIPKDILAAMGKDIAGGILPNGGKNNMAFQMPYGNNERMMRSLVSSMKGTANNMTFGNINIGGSNSVTRSEVRQMFGEFQTAVLEVVSKAIHG